MTKTFQYSTIKGYFLPDEDETLDSGNYHSEEVNFGLINREYVNDRKLLPKLHSTPWQRFENEVNCLNEESKPGEQYKVLYIARHGQGVHNVAERKYGRPEWNAKWSKLEGDGDLRWADAELTEDGISQAGRFKSAWASHIETQKTSLPQTFYTSPLIRACRTTEIMVSEPPPFGKQFVPKIVVKESLRELHGVHTCDRRSPMEIIHNAFPDFLFEDGFAEKDELWSDVRESDTAVDARMKSLLDDLFDKDPSTFISFTSHCWAIHSILRVLGHRPFKLTTGCMITVFVKATEIKATAIAP